MFDKVAAKIGKPLLGHKVLSPVEVNITSCTGLLMIRDDWVKAATINHYNINSTG